MEQTDDNLDDDILAEAEQLIESASNENSTKNDKKEEISETLPIPPIKSSDEKDKKEDDQNDKTFDEIAFIEDENDEKSDDAEKKTDNENSEAAKINDVDEEKDDTSKIVVDSEKETLETSEKVIGTKISELSEKDVETKGLETSEKNVETENLETSEKAVETEKLETSEKDVEAEKSETPEKIVESENSVSNNDEEDDLLISCDAPKVDPLSDEKLQKEVDDSSSNVDDILDECTSKSNDDGDKSEEKSILNESENELTSENEESKPKTIEVNEFEAMDVDENSKSNIEDQKSSNGDIESVIKPSKQDAEDDEKSSIKEEEEEETKDLKLNFLRRFATATGKLSRPELEELLIEKITECFLFSSENASLRMRIEKQEKISESLQTRMESLKKQYNDLNMIHKRIMKDLSDRPGSSIIPVKITRAVGLQVYQPASGTQLKRKNEEIIGNLSKTSELKVITPEQKRRKITPLRAPLTETQKMAIDQKNIIEEQRLKEDITKSLINSQSVTLTARKSTANSNGSAAIDLTDEDDNTTSNKTQPMPPALVAINALTQNTTRTLLKTYIPTLPNAVINERPGWKKFAPKPTVSIIKAAQKNGIIVQWRIDGYDPKVHSVIKSYEIYAYEAQYVTTNSVQHWRRVGDVKALPLPMAITLTQFTEGIFIQF